MEGSCIKLQAYAGFGYINRNLHQQRMRAWKPCRPLSSRGAPALNKSICMRLEGTENEGSDLNKSSNYSEGKYEPLKADSTAEAMDARREDGASGEKKRTAKIHDFCLGIPFGTIILTGGFVGYLFSRNLASLSAGLLFGLPQLAFSCASLKVWRHGLSSLPFILGQGALAAALFWKHFQTYSLTKKFFFPGLYALLSAAMFSFYSYVLLSGGNPPPKAKAAASKSA